MTLSPAADFRTRKFLLDPIYYSLETQSLEGEVAEMAKSASPLCLAMSLAPGEVHSYPHIRLLDTYLVSLVHLQLYRDGPGPPPDVWTRQIEGQGEWLLAGNGLEVALSEETYAAQEIRYTRPDTGPEPDLEDQVVTNLSVAFPPRHGKSFLVTEHLPLWFLILYPTAAILLATYSGDFAEKWGSALKDKLSSQGKRLPLASDGRPLKALSSTNANASFRPGKDRGEINYRGVGGSITGTGFTLGVIDDPFKGSEDALSEAERTAKKNWYTAVFSNRPTPQVGLPPPLQVFITTRWHEDDLCGAFTLDEDGETPKPGWCNLRLPALAEPGGDDPLGREEGQSLCPQMASKDFLEAQLNSDPVWFSCLYQGTPIHAQGSMFEKTYEETPGATPTFHHYRYDPIRSEYTGPGNQVVDAKGSATVHFMTIDTATSKRTQADWTVFANWAFCPWTNKLILVDRLRDRISTSEYLEHLDMFLAQQRREAEPLIIGVENRTFGTGLINELRRDRPELTIIPLKADRDKISRSTPYAKAVGAGNVWFPDPLWVPWAVSWENEHTNFPRAKHDDQVDVGAYAYLHSRSYLRPGETPPDQDPEPVPEPTHVQRGMTQIRRKQGKPLHPYTQLLDRVQPGSRRR